MLIQSTSVTVNYKKIDSIKKAYINNEEKLKNHFNSGTVLPIPDDAPLEYPRIMATTHNEHGQLSISPTGTTFRVVYNNGFEQDWGKCSDYLKKRMYSVFSLLNSFTEDTYEYIGLVSTILFDDIKNNGTRIIAKNLLKSQNINDLYDIDVKFTFVKNEKIFTNITLQNARIFKQGVNISKAGDMSSKNQIEESVGVILDINDRYCFNNDPNYQSNSRVLDELIECMDDVINNKLEPLVKKGEL